MPQPLSSVRPNADIIIGNAGGSPLARHPELAVLAIEAIASWSNVEAFLLRLFMQLLGGNESLAASVYLSLDGQSAKTKALKTAAANALQNKPQELGILEAIIAISKTNEKDRNKLAHWTWGDSPELPDAVLLVDPRATLNGVVRSDIYVYRERDFRNIVQANNRLCGFGLELKFILSGSIANRDGRLVARLAAEPEIAERLKYQAVRPPRQ